MNKTIDNYTEKLANELPEVNWTEAEKEAIKNCLKALVAKCSSIVYPREPISEASQNFLENYILAAILTKHLNKEASVIKIPNPEFGLQETKEQKIALSKLFKPAEYVEKSDLNSLPETELKSLSGISKKTAEQIARYKNKHGYITSMQKMQTELELDEEEFKTLQEAATVHSTRPNRLLVTPESYEFKSNTTIFIYLKALYKNSKNVDDYKANLLEALLDTFAHMEGNTQKLFGSLILHPNEIEKRFEENQKYLTLDKQWTKSDGIAPINDSQYIYFIDRLMKEAKESIRIVMFFMRSEPEIKYPTDTLFATIVEAKERGVKVQVILDKDVEGDVYKSRLINKNAYDFFVKNNIDVTYDNPEELTHSKMVIVDGKHVVIGSHNWTAGSFYVYDDKSVYIQSDEFGEKATEKFQKLWKRYKTEPA